MDKHSILSVDYHSIQKNLNLKQLVLLFDKICIEENSLYLARSFVNIVPDIDKSPGSLYHFNNQNIEFLGNKGILESDSINNKPIQVKTDSQDGLFMIQTVKEWGSLNDLIVEFQMATDKKELLVILLKKLKQLPVDIARTLAIRMRIEGLEAYPIYEETPNFNSLGTKENVIKFVLSQIPQPSDSVSWEQLMDFKSDPDTMKKLYALINWVNEVSRKQVPISEIEDEYKFLYHDYASQYELHKLKSKQGVLEVIVTAAIDAFFSGLGVGVIKTALFSLFKKEMSLMEAESKFTGREVAYIYKAGEKFD